MKLENYEVHLPNYSIGDKIYDKIGPVCESYGKNGSDHWRKTGTERSGRQDSCLCGKNQIIRDHRNQDLWNRLYLRGRGKNCVKMPEYEEADMVLAWRRKGIRHRKVFVHHG